MKTAVSFRKVDIIFGDRPETALPLVDQYKNREEILEQTGQILGVADASLDVYPGEVCVLMGLSGSGKSTLLRAVNGLNKIIRGEVIISHEGEQTNVADCNASTLRDLRMHTVAMVFQQFALLPWRTVRENVGLGLELQGISKAEITERVDDKLRMVGLLEWAEKYAHELSGGMQQRVGLARAFVTDADILLMDEPFSALDPLIRDRLQDELLELQSRLNKTIIFVSHDLDEALKIGTKIAIMESGRVVQYAKPEAIVLNPANDYVSDFVAHMNPLNVLRGSTLMRSLNDLPIVNGSVLIDDRLDVTIQLNDDHTIRSAHERGKELSTANAQNLLDSQSDVTNTLALVEKDQRMRDIIRLRDATGLPVVMLEDNKLIGIIGDKEIYQGILRQIQGVEKKTEQ